MGCDHCLEGKQEYFEGIGQTRSREVEHSQEQQLCTAPSGHAPETGTEHVALMLTLPHSPGAVLRWHFLPFTGPKRALCKYLITGSAERATRWVCCAPHRDLSARETDRHLAPCMGATSHPSLLFFSSLLHMWSFVISAYRPSCWRWIRPTLSLLTRAYVCDL